MRKIVDYGEYDDDVTESNMTLSTATAQIKEEYLLDGLIYAASAGTEGFADKMKEAYEMRKAEMGKICFYCDTDFRDTMDSYEESGESLEVVESRIYRPAVQR